MNQKSESSQAILRIVDLIGRYRLEVATLFLLESHLPLRGVVHVVSEAFSPLLTLVVGKDNQRDLQEILESSEQVQLLVAELENRISGQKQKSV